jgi:hypothetical protein
MIESWVQRRNIGERLKPWLHRFEMSFTQDQMDGMAEGFSDDSLRLPEDSEGGESP